MPSPETQRHQSFAGSYQSSSNTGYGMDNPYGPLTAMLPMNTQQLLGDGMFGFMDSQTFPMSKSGRTGMNQPMYNYNPNGNLKPSKKRTHEEMATSSGLEQTLMPTALNTSFGDQNKSAVFGGPFSANTDLLSSATTDPIFDFGYNDNEFGLDLFNTSNSSGQASPEEFANFVNDDLFGDSQYAF